MTYINIYSLLCYLIIPTSTYISKNKKIYILIPCPKHTIANPRYVIINNYSIFFIIEFSSNSTCILIKYK